MNCRIAETFFQSSVKCVEIKRGAMKKSIGDNMIPKGLEFEQGLELVKKSGYDGIELWLGDVPWFQMNTTDAAVSELRRKVENAGLVVSNVSTGLHWETPLSSRDPNVRAKAIRIVERQIETSQILGCDADSCGGGSRDPGSSLQRGLPALRRRDETACPGSCKSESQNRLRELQFGTTLFADSTGVLDISQ